MGDEYQDSTLKRPPNDGKTNPTRNKGERKVILLIISEKS